MKSLLCRKQLDQLLRDTEQTKHRLKRSLGARYSRKRSRLRT